jgi:hypothetical protein
VWRCELSLSDSRLYDFDVDTFIPTTFLDFYFGATEEGRRPERN